MSGEEFEWKKTISRIVKKNNGSIKKSVLKNEVIIEFMSRNPETKKSKKELAAKFELKVRKCTKIKISNNMISVLNNNEVMEEESPVGTGSDRASAPSDNEAGPSRKKRKNSKPKKNFDPTKFIESKGPIIYFFQGRSLSRHKYSFFTYLVP